LAARFARAALIATPAAGATAPQAGAGWVPGVVMAPYQAGLPGATMAITNPAAAGPSSS
jgi:hypothetical protein